MSTHRENADAAALKRTRVDRVRGARGWSRIAPVLIHRTDDGVEVIVYWRRMLPNILALVVMAWATLPFAAWAYVHAYKDVKDVRYGHLALPWRWDEYRAIRAAHYVATAKAMLEHAQWRGAYLNLRVGLQKDPANREGRLLLAQFYRMLRRFELAEETLVDGLVYHRTDDAYLQAVLTFLLQAQNDARVVALADDVLADSGASGARKRIAALHAAVAYAYRGSYDKAEALIVAHRLDETREGRMLGARIEWERGYPELALLALEQLRVRLPADDEVAGMLAGYYIEVGRLDDARRLHLLRQVANPGSPQPRIALLRVLMEAGDVSGARREVDGVMADFPNDGVVLALLAEQAANAGDTALVRRIYAHCKTAGLAWDAPAVFAVESCILAGRHEEALDLARELLRENPEWSRRHRTLFNGLQAVALHGLGDHDAGRLYVRNFLGETGIRSEQLASVSRRLVEVGAMEDARELLVRAVQDDSLDQAALMQLIELDLAAGRIEALPGAVKKLLTMRRTPPRLLARVRDELGKAQWQFLEGRAEVLEALGVMLRLTRESETRER